MVTLQIGVSNTANSEQLSTLQAYEGKLPEDVCDVIRHDILTAVDATFEGAS
jgi:hypothetical protein